MHNDTPKGPSHVNQQFDQARQGPEVKPPETLESLQAERKQLEKQIKKSTEPHETYEMDGSIGEEVRAGVNEKILARYTAILQKIPQMERERERLDAIEETRGPEKDEDGDQEEEPEMA